MQKDYGLILLAGLFVLDQLTKLFFTGKSYGIIHYQENYGAAFSLLQGYKWLFIIVAIIVTVALYIYYDYAEKKWPLIFIMAGSLGNMADRIVYGYVRDFIDLKVWPVFNLADSLNLIGAVALAYYLIKKT